MAGDLVLITGATGFIGFRVLRSALEHGYSVRVAVRSEAKGNTLKSNPVLKAMGKDSQISFITVPDFVAPGAFDDAVKDVKYVLHVASPIPPAEEVAPEKHEQFYIAPAVQGTLGVFESARKSGSVKRIVVTSSAVAIIPISALMDGSGDEVFTAESRVDNMAAPYPSAYVASKIAALNAAESWIKKEQPAFDAIYIHPPYVLGRDDLVTRTSDYFGGTNKLVLDLVLGKVEESPRPGSTVHVDDVALVHVLALDEKIKGNQSFVTDTPGGIVWEDVNNIVAQRFPDAVKSGILPNSGSVATFRVYFDVEKTEKTFAIKLQGFETQVVSVVRHYVELAEAEKTVNGK